MNEKRLSRAMVMRILGRVKRDLSMVCIESDNYEIQNLKSRICNYIDKLGIDHINNEDIYGKTVLDFIIEIDSKGKSRLNNPVLIELEKYAKDHGATIEEFSPFEINRYIFRLLKRARIEDMSLPEREEYIPNLNKMVIDNVNTFLIESRENGDSLFFERVCASIIFNIYAVFPIVMIALAKNLNDHNRNRQENTSSTMLEQANINMLSATTKKH
ncbi:MAG: hypothetical protein sL5_02550 [Candidatus Mesenet longicola]|uniref:Uncharacterized protein n=1 Tax=Candidatus Mesenet longicola TaxID=1892558 RepID=A0A8J3MQ78_9RICK|nr:MAG: hypothetical protein sGL2_02470 [Candidatus Mesenet longicola]GHM59262.1 MAG: hypothetical protein sL5_02550 [Candidatus Mesenet longicola]